MRSFSSIIAIVAGLAVSSQCLGAENQLLKYDASGNPIGSAAYEKDGKVGVGTDDPQTVLHVKADVNSSSVMRVTNVNTGSSAYAALQFGLNGIALAGAIFQNSTSNSAYAGPGSFNIGSIASYPVSIVAGNSSKVIVLPNGRVGIGTMTPGSTLLTGQETPLHVFTTADANEFLLMQNSSNTVNANARMRVFADVANVDLISHASARTVSRWGVTLGGWNEVLTSAGNGLAVGTLYSTPLILGTSSTARLTIDGSGGVTIGSSTAPSNTTIYGTLSATQVIGAAYQDVAEWVPATTKMAPGTVVVLNREHRNEVMPSAHAYDTAVAGVVSAQPGVILGVAGDAKAQIATTGRVKVHVDASAAPIGIGDLLVTSERSGTAMKSQPVDLGGVQFHRPGTVIGKALEPLPAGEGEILVLLSLQ